MANQVNPHENAIEEGRKATEYSFMTFGRVTDALKTTHDGQHHVTVQESAAPTDQPLPVLPSVHGDYYIPPKGAPVGVVPQGRNQYNIVAAGIPKVETPAIEPGERIISHPLSESHVKFHADGGLDVYADSKIRINGGDTGIVTDVQAASTNSNNGITELDIIRNNNILI